MNKEAEQRDDFAKKFEQQGILLQTLMDTVPYPIFHKSPDGLYAGCNRAFENLVGCSREEVIGKEVGQLFPEALAEVYEANDRQESRLQREPPELRAHARDAAHPDSQDGDTSGDKID